MQKVNQISHYLYPSTWMVSPGAEERREVTPRRAIPKEHMSHN